MPLVLRRPTIADLSDADVTAALNAPPQSNEERERDHPQLAWMRRRAAEAIADLQREGILDAEGNLVHPEYLPADMQPSSDTEC